MPTRALVQPPRTFTDLVRQVRDALVHGQAAADRAYLETYRQTGLLIEAHLLLHRQRAEYGAQVIPKLSEALGVNDRLLYRCIRFVRAYPILTGRSELGWSHYRLLIEIPDKARRKALETEAIKHHWSATELERHVRLLNAINVTPPPPAHATTSSPPRLLTPKRGTPGLCRVLPSATGLALDLGFSSYLDLPADTPLHAGDLALPHGDTYAPAPTAKKSDLYTYPATLLHVIDGDTLWVQVYLRPAHWVRQKLRLRDLDCPELDTPAGRAAKKFTAHALSLAHHLTITTTKPDKYDRYLSDIFLLAEDGTETYLNNALLAAGHAIRKDGGYTPADWGD